jgi:peptidoglycan/xylan/chitin deacetylase (PgdA/CDA1 family)
VTPRELRGQLELLAKRGYRAATFHEVVTSTPSEPTVAITFDDGFASVLELAFPILSALGLVATVFVVTDFADRNDLLEWPGVEGWRGGPHEHEVRGLSWAELDRLATSGWEIGSHTRTHPRLTGLDDEALGAELRESRDACERALARPCRSLAYPFGDVDARVVAAASRAGYEAAATLPRTVNGSAPLTYPRTGVYRKDSPRRFRLKISPTVHRVREILAPVETRLRA